MLQPAKQSLSPLRIEVRGDFIEQKDRRFAAAFRDQLGMGEDEPEQKRLLLAGRGLRRGHSLGAVRNGEILPVRAFDRAARSGIPAAIACQSRRKIREVPTLQRNRRAGEFVFRSVAQSLVQRRDRP